MSVQIDQEYEVVRLDGDHDPLHEHPRNPRRGDVDVIGESMDVNGWYGAVVAQKSTGYILAGNHRYRVAKEKGATEIPVIWKDVDDETALKILLADNKTADAGDYDEALLEELLQGLETLDGTGYILASAQETIEVGTGGTPMQARDHGKGEVPPADPVVGDNPASFSPDEIPEDKYEPSFAVIIVCKSERQQEETYRWLQEQMPKRKDQIRLTAV